MMQRPVMNPMFLDEGRGTKASARKQSRWRACLTVFKFVGRIGRVLFTDVFRRKERLKDEVGTPTSRFLRRVLYRLMFAPTLLAVVACVLVAAATHPKQAAGLVDPSSHGVYYDPVDLLSLDNTKLEGWLIPVLDARKVLKHGNDILHKRHAAIVLVHDFGSSRQQMLPLVAPLHDAGYVVLAINLRGRGPSSNTGSTFGLNEAQDVRAAVEMLRRRAFVDVESIGVIGIGTGATAALLAAEQDPKIAALVLDHPVTQFEDVLNERIGPKHAMLGWMRPFCKWAFEIGYKVDADDMDLSRFSRLMKDRPVLLMDDASETASSLQANRIKQILPFLKRHLIPRNRSLTSLLQREAVGAVRMDEAPGDGPAEQPSWPPQQSAAEILRRAKATGW